MNKFTLALVSILMLASAAGCTANEDHEPSDPKDVKETSEAPLTRHTEIPLAPPAMTAGATEIAPYVKSWLMPDESVDTLEQEVLPSTTVTEVEAAEIQIHSAFRPALVAVRYYEGSASSVDPQGTPIAEFECLETDATAQCEALVIDDSSLHLDLHATLPATEEYVISISCLYYAPRVASNDAQNYNVVGWVFGVSS